MPFVKSRALSHWFRILCIFALVNKGWKLMRLDQNFEHIFCCRTSTDTSWTKMNSRVAESQNTLSWHYVSCFPWYLDAQWWRDTLMKILYSYCRTHRVPTLQWLFPSPSSSPSSVTKPIIIKTSIFSWFEHRNQHIIHGRKEDGTGVHLEMTKTKTHTMLNTRTKTELSRRKSSCIYKFGYFA